MVRRRPARRGWDQVVAADDAPWHDAENSGGLTDSRRATLDPEGRATPLTNPGGQQGPETAHRAIRIQEQEGVVFTVHRGSDDLTQVVDAPGLTFRTAEGAEIDHDPVFPHKGTAVIVIVLWHLIVGCSLADDRAGGLSVVFLDGRRSSAVFPVCSTGGFMGDGPAVTEGHPDR